MIEGTDLKTLKIAVRTRTDLGTLLFASGLGAILDAVWNVAPYADFYAAAPWCGLLALGLKKLALDRDPPTAAPTAAGTPDTDAS